MSNNSEIFKKVLTSVWKYKFNFSLALLVLAAGSAINLIFPGLIRYLINSKTYFIEHSTSISFILIGLFILQAICFYWRSYLFAIVGHEVINDLRRDLFTSIIHRPVSFFEERSSSELTSRLIGDPILVQDLVSLRLSVLIRYGLQVIFGTVLMFTISFKLSLTILLAIPVLVLISMLLSKRLKGASKDLQAKIASAGAAAEEYFSSIKTIKAFVAEKFAETNYSQQSNLALEAGYLRSKISSFFQSFVSFLLNAAIILVLFYGIKLVIAGNISTGDLTGFLLYGILVGVSFALFVGAFSETLIALGAAERVYEYIELNPSPNENLTIHEIDQIVIKNLSFTYPTRPGVVLNNINFEILKNQKILILGESGSGKSSLLQLLLAYYNYEGEILISGKDLKALDKIEYRKKIAYVPQEPPVFSFSIRDNLLLGRKFNDSEIWSVLEQVRLKDHVQNLTQGLDSPLGQTFSVGQKQRFAIARALLAKPEVILLDEITSALDSENELQITEIILNLKCTIIFVSHRLNQTEAFDKILILNNANIQATGTHQELINSSPDYKKFYENYFRSNKILPTND